MDLHVIFMKTSYKIERILSQSTEFNSKLHIFYRTATPINSSNLANIFQVALVLHLNSEISAF